MDFLEYWTAQAEQQLNWYNVDNMTPQERRRTLKELMLGLYEEVGELQGAADTDRIHILRNPSQNKSNITEQGVDVFKMLMSILQLCGITPAEFEDVFRSKTRIVQDRWKGQHIQLEKETKLFITDLDGCVVDMTEFEGYLNQFRDADDQAGTQAALEAVKDKFYINGGFLNLPPIEGAIEALTNIKKMGYTVIVCTARPYWQYRRLYSDTMKWSQKHGLAYDHIIFGKDKAEVIWEQIHPARPTWFVEDRMKHLHELVDIGVPVLLFNTPRNQGDLPDSCRRVTTWKAIEDYARDSLKEG